METLVINPVKSVKTSIQGKFSSIISKTHGVVNEVITPSHYREYLELVPTKEVLNILNNESLKDYTLSNGDIVRISNDIYEDLGLIVSQSDLFLTDEDPNAINWEYTITKECLIGLTIVQ
jgi:hypothetical protein